MDFIYITIWHEDIGKCKICHNDNQYVINSLSVTKHLRRHGIGSSLINSAEDIIKKLGGDYAYLYVNAEDVWKYEWYKRLGYIDVDEAKEDGFFKMRKAL
jgi:ribosomal protein S18 acetylase RimI-like enzyme